MAINSMKTVPEAKMMLKKMSMWMMTLNDLSPVNYIVMTLNLGLTVTG